MRPIFARCLAAVLLAAPMHAQAKPLPTGLEVERVVIVMRHGVRSPTKAPAMPAGVAADAWPEWPVPPGHLTANGTAAVRLIGADDRERLLAARLLPGSGCPSTGAVRLVADSDQRTIATAQAWAEGVAPGCAVAIDHQPQDVADPRFSPIDEGLVTLDPARAESAVLSAAGLGGIEAIEARMKPVLARLDAILCGTLTQGCGLTQRQSRLVISSGRARPKLSGALDMGSTAAQVLLLEYADGKPIEQVGWGRADRSDIARLSELHAMEFALLARPKYLAQAGFAGLAPVVLSALQDRSASHAKVTLISGHDTNVANLAGLIGAHWQVPGLAPDDPAPGGAIILERLTDNQGNAYVRALYRAMTVEQLRVRAPHDRQGPLYLTVEPIAGCRERGIPGLCSEEAFSQILSGKFARADSAP